MTKSRIRLPAIMALCAALIAACATTAPGDGKGGVDRLYVLNCGESKVTDVSRWTPGINAGKPYEFSANCYVVRHSSGRVLMWDTGITDDVAKMPEGFQRNPQSPRYWLRKTMVSQLADIGLTPLQITDLAMSHTHGDHVGNANLFTAATLYIQQAEYDAAFGPEARTKFGFDPSNYEKLRGNRLVKLNGDHDVFGDGSVVLLATPGHTPGHQALFVRLRRNGPVILSGDLVHLQDNWAQRRVPSFNYDREASLKSMDKVAALMKATGAQLWINHDKAQSDRIPKAPAFTD
jgi:N-acyl homoserine lactone hydrolase